VCDTCDGKKAAHDEYDGCLAQAVEDYAEGDYTALTRDCGPAHPNHDLIETRAIHRGLGGPVYDRPLARAVHARGDSDGEKALRRHVEELEAEYAAAGLALASPRELALLTLERRVELLEALRPDLARQKARRPETKGRRRRRTVSPRPRRSRQTAADFMDVALASLARRVPDADRCRAYATTTLLAVSGKKTYEEAAWAAIAAVEAMTKAAREQQAFEHTQETARLRASAATARHAMGLEGEARIDPRTMRLVPAPEVSEQERQEHEETRLRAEREREQRRREEERIAEIEAEYHRSGKAPRVMGFPQTASA
jgi:hypothetical protein